MNGVIGVWGCRLGALGDFEGGDGVSEEESSRLGDGIGGVM